MTSAPGPDNDEGVTDPATPLAGIVVCCTSIAPERRTEIAQTVVELGGLHKYDLTPDVTHLIVGDYDTAKYRHVARERPDILAMDADWIPSILDLWRSDSKIDLRQLEQEYKLLPLEKSGAGHASEEGDEKSGGGREPLLICLTGFGGERDVIAELITSNGGKYTGDLTRRCSHLIVHSPEGKKFAAARSWGIRTVTLQWLHRSVERGMILDEAKFDPHLPADQQGVGAWEERDVRRTSLGKRAISSFTHDKEEGRRKLRKTASMKLSSQRNDLWVDILRKPSAGDAPTAEARPDQTEEGTAATLTADTAPVRAFANYNAEGVFAMCVFFIHGFDAERSNVLRQTLVGLGGTVASTLEEAAGQSPILLNRFLVVPQTMKSDAYPTCPHKDMRLVTELYIERCLHHKTFFDPSEHVLGRPFSQFPLPGFEGLSICSAAFTGIELNQVARSIVQLGASFSERFTKDASLVICRSFEATRTEKLRLAAKWGVPVVKAEWLWECIATGSQVPMDRYRLKPSSKQPDVEAAAVADEFRSTKPRNKPTQAAKASNPALHELSDASINKSCSPPKSAAGSSRTSGGSIPKATEKRDTQQFLSEHRDSWNTTNAAEQNDGARHQVDRRLLNSKLTDLISSACGDGEASHLHELEENDGESRTYRRSAASGPRGRRRQILGRATSSVSAGSSAAAADPFQTAPEILQKASALGLGGSGGGGSGGGGSGGGGGGEGHESAGSVALVPDDQTEEEAHSAPPATQIGYVDPDAEGARAALLSRMAGGSKSASLDKFGSAEAVTPGRRTLRGR